MIDVVLSNKDDIEKESVDGYNAIQVAYRVYKVYNYFSSRQGLIRAQRAYPNVQFRHIIGPK